MKIYYSKHLIVFIGIATVFICLGIYKFLFSYKPALPTNLSFYCWQNQFELDSNAQSFLDRHKVRHLHVKLFELSLDLQTNGAVVNNYIHPEYSSDFFLRNTLTPVVFIDNDIFYSIDSTRIREMAGLVKRAMIIHSANLFNPNRKQWSDIWAQLYFSLQMVESKPDSLNQAYQQFKKNIISYEFDCDWTVKTQKKYFYFLQQVKDSLHKRTEATLRLHQYKYRDKNGIPPVDVVNLMCYNMGELLDQKEQNSIFNTKILRKYIEGQPIYPIPLNIALPTFSWIVVFRNNQFYKLIPGNALNEYIEDNSHQLEKIDSYNFIVRNEFNYHWKEEALKPGDQLRLEKVSNSELIEGYKVLTNELQLAPKEVILFDLNNTLKIENFNELAKHINL